MQTDTQNDKSSKQMDDPFDYQTENDQDSLGVRDVLLIKCKSVIQDLHQEIADLNQEKADQDERILQLEQLLDDKDKQIRQSIYQNENIVDEFQNERAQVQMLQEKNNQLEKEIMDYKQNEEAIIQQLEELTATNSEMKQKVQELTQELEKRDHIAQEWHQTMQSVSTKIQELDKENQQLTSERNQMLISLEKISPRSRFDQMRNTQQFQDHQMRTSQSNQLNDWLQQTVDNLQNAIRDNEKKNQFIDQLQKENLNLKSNNMTLQRALEQNQHLFSQNQINNNFETQTINKTISNQNNHQQTLNPAQSQLTQEIQNIQLQMNQLKQECGEKEQEIQKIQSENIQLKEKINVLNRKYLNAEIDSRKIDSSINNQISSIEINRNNEISKYKELIQEQKELINQLQNNDYIINQAKEIAKLQQTNEFLNTRLIECKQELNLLQQEVIIQFEKEDHRCALAQQKLKQFEQIVKERDEVIKCQNQDIDQMKQIISQHNSNRSRQASRERQEALKQELIPKDEIENHDRTLLTLMNENKNLQAQIESLQDQLKNEKLTRIREQNAIQRMKTEVQSLEDQYNREISFYKTEFTRQMTEPAAASGNNSNIQQSQQLLQNYQTDGQQLNTEINSEYVSIEIKVIKNQEKKLKKTKKEKASSSLKEGKTDIKTGSKSKLPKKKEKKKTDQSQSIITPSIVMDRFKENEVSHQLGERVNSVSKIQQNAKIQQTPQQTQRINYNQALNNMRQEYDQGSFNNQQGQYNTINSSATVRNQPYMGYYKTIQQPQQQPQVQQHQIIKSNEQNQDQIVDRFKHAINRIENKLERMTVDLKLHDSEDDDDFKMSNYYKINK